MPVRGSHGVLDIHLVIATWLTFLGDSGRLRHWNGSWSWFPDTTISYWLSLSPWVLNDRRLQPLLPLALGTRPRYILILLDKHFATLVSPLPLEPVPSPGSSCHVPGALGIKNVYLVTSHHLRCRLSPNSSPCHFSLPCVSGLPLP